MTISIITTTYNSAATITDTLTCVRDQQHTPVEHIIIDGNSSDNTLELVKSFPHVAKLVSEPDKGIYDAMNKGLRLVSGDVIGILNSDDVYTHNQVLSRVAKVFENKDVDVCYADLQYVQHNDTSKIIRRWKSGHGNRNSFYWGWMPPHPTVFVRRSVYDRIGHFNTNLRSAADYELLLRIFVKHNFNIHYLPEFIVKMRAGGMSNASLKNRLRANREDREAWRINNLSPYFFTTLLKPLRKITQFIIR